MVPLYSYPPHGRSLEILTVGGGGGGGVLVGLNL